MPRGRRRVVGADPRVVSSPGTGSIQDPYSIESEEDEQHASDNIRSKRAQKRASRKKPAPHKEQDLNRFLSDAGLNPAELSPGEKEGILEATHQAQWAESMVTTIKDSTKINSPQKEPVPKQRSRKSKSPKEGQASWAAAVTYSDTSDTSDKDSSNASDKEMPDPDADCEQGGADEELLTIICHKGSSAAAKLARSNHSSKIMTQGEDHEDEYFQDIIRIGGRGRRSGAGRQQAEDGMTAARARRPGGVENEEALVGDRMICHEMSSTRGSQLEPEENIVRKSPRKIRVTKRAKANSPTHQAKPKRMRITRMTESTQAVASNLTATNAGSDLSNTLSVTPVKKGSRVGRSAVDVEVMVRVKISPANSQGKAEERSNTEDETVDPHELSEHGEEDSTQGSQGETQSSQSMLSPGIPLRDALVEVPTSQSRVSQSRSAHATTEDSEIESSLDLFLPSQPIEQMAADPAGDETQDLEMEVEEVAEDKEAMLVATADDVMQDENAQDKSTGTEEPTPVPTKAPYPGTDDYPYDVFYETAKQRQAAGKGGETGIMGNRIQTENGDSEEVKTCPFCPGTTPPHHTVLKNKTKCRMKLVDPAPYFAPHGVSPESYMQTIAGYFNAYRLLLCEQQKKRITKLPWCDPVVPGRHCTRTLFVKVRGQAEEAQRAFDINDSASPDLHYGSFPSVNNGDDGTLPELDPVAKHPTSWLRRNAQRRNQVYSNEEGGGGDGDEDFVVTVPNKSKNNGRGTKRSKDKKTEETITSAYFTNALVNKNYRIPRKPEKEETVPETQDFNLVLEGDSSDDCIPAVWQQKEKFDDANPAAGPSASVSCENEFGKWSGRTTLQDANNSGSESDLPSLLKLTTQSALDYDDEVQNMCMGKENVAARLDGGKCKPPTPVKAGTLSPDHPACNKEAGENIVLFESPEEERRSLDTPPTGTSRKKLKFQKKKKTANEKRVDEAEDGTIDIYRKTRAMLEPQEAIDDVVESVEQGGAKQSNNRGDRRAGQETFVRNTRTRMSKMDQDQKGGSGEDKMLTETIAKVKQRTPMQRKTVVIQGPFRNLNNQPTGAGVAVRPSARAMQVLVPPVEEEEEEEKEMVECPMCPPNCFPISIIERHAANCEGPPSSASNVADIQGAQPQVVEARQTRHDIQAKTRGVPTSAQGAPPGAARDSDTEQKLSSKRPGQAAPSTPTKRQRVEEPTGACPICNRVLPTKNLETHVNDCIVRQEQGEPEVPRRTRAKSTTQGNSGPPCNTPSRGKDGLISYINVRGNAAAPLRNVTGWRPLRLARPRLTLPKAQTQNVIALDDSDEEIPPTADAANFARKPLSQAHHSYSQEFLDAEGNEKPAVKIRHRTSRASSASTKSPALTPNAPLSPRSTSSKPSSLMSMVPKLSDPTSPSSHTSPKAHRGSAVHAGAGGRGSSRVGTRSGTSRSAAIPAGTSRGAASHVSTSPAATSLGAARTSRGAASHVASNICPEAGSDYSHTTSNSDTSGSVYSISDADNDVPLGAALAVPPSAATTGITRGSQETRPSSPVRSFCPISSLEGGSGQIDYRNQFRRARGGPGSSGGVKRKAASTGRRHKKRKRRKRSSTRGRGAKSMSVVQPKKIKEEW